MQLGKPPGYLDTVLEKPYSLQDTQRFYQLSIWKVALSSYFLVNDSGLLPRRLISSFSFYISRIEDHLVLIFVIQIRIFNYTFFIFMEFVFPVSLL